MRDWEDHGGVQKKKHRGRWAYLDDFQRSASGEMIYTGGHFAYTDARGRSRRRLLTLLLVSNGLSAVCALIQGFLREDAMFGCFYVLLPYAGELIFSISVVWALVQLSLHKEPLREYIYDATVATLNVRTGLTAAFSGVTFLGDVLFLILYGLRQPQISLPFLALSLLSLAGALVSFRLRKGVVWDNTEGSGS